MTSTARTLPKRAPTWHVVMFAIVGHGRAVVVPDIAEGLGREASAVGSIVRGLHSHRLVIPDGNAWLPSDLGLEWLEVVGPPKQSGPAEEALAREAEWRRDVPIWLQQGPLSLKTLQRKLLVRYKAEFAVFIESFRAEGCVVAAPDPRGVVLYGLPLPPPKEPRREPVRRLTLGQIAVLRLLAKGPPMNRQRVAELLGIAPSQASNRLTGLGARGFAKYDNKNRWSITAEGTSALSQCQ